jgi:hypothetical protein
MYATAPEAPVALGAVRERPPIALMKYPYLPAIAEPASGAEPLIQS